MAGMNRLDRAKNAREKARQMEAQAKKLEGEEQEIERRKDASRKVIIGGAMLAAIRMGRMDRSAWEYLIWPGISERVRQRLNGWPWTDPNDSIQSSES